MAAVRGKGPNRARPQTEGLQTIWAAKGCIYPKPGRAAGHRDAPKSQRGAQDIGVGRQGAGNQAGGGAEIPALCLPVLTERPGLKGCAGEGRKILRVS